MECEICIIKAAARNHLGSTKRYKELMNLFLKQNKLCPESGILMQIGTNASLDHIIPISKGGKKNDIQNLQWVHIVVNIFKSDKDEEEFRAEFHEFIEQSSKHLGLVVELGRHNGFKPRCPIGREGSIPSEVTFCF